jgi:STE24 endopeptidase
MFSLHPILIIVLAVIAFNTIIDVYLNYRSKRSWKEQIPSEAESLMNNDTYLKAKAYANDKNKLAFWSGFVSHPIALCALVFGGFGLLADKIHSEINSPIICILVFLGIIGFISLLLSLPFSYYDTFIIEEKYGFNKTDKKTFFLDLIKSMLLSVVIGGVLLSIIIWIYEINPNAFWWRTWIVISIFSLLMNIFYTDWLLPIFNKLKPIEDGELKNSIVDYCKKVAFNLDNVFIIDGSKRSAKANAFFSGLGKRKKIVLYDTLLEKNTNEEIVAILAHEAGHYKKHHIIQSLVTSVILSGLTLFIFSLFLGNQELSKALGANGQYLELELIVIGLLYSPLNTLTSLVLNYISRKNEFEADAFAKSTYHQSPLKTGLVKLYRDSLSNPCPDALNVFWHYSHPPLLERLKVLG